MKFVTGSSYTSVRAAQYTLPPPCTTDTYIIFYILCYSWTTRNGLLQILRRVRFFSLLTAALVSQTPPPAACSTPVGRYSPRPTRPGPPLYHAPTCMCVVKVLPGYPWVTASVRSYAIGSTITIISAGVCNAGGRRRACAWNQPAAPDLCAEIMQKPSSNTVVSVVLYCSSRLVANR